MEDREGWMGRENVWLGVKQEFLETPENMQRPSVTTVSQSGCREEEKLPPGRYLLIPPRAKCLMPGSKKGIKGFHPTYWWGKEKKLV